MPEACESNVRACERVKKVLRRVTHAEDVCLGRSAELPYLLLISNIARDSFHTGLAACRDKLAQFIGRFL